MKFSISKMDLQEALSIVSKGMSARSTVAILSGIYISAREGKLVLQTTDLEISVRCSCLALVEISGEAVVPGKLLSEIVRSLPDAAISCELIGDVFSISCLSSTFTLNTMNSADFPAFPQVELIDTITLPASKLSGVVKKVSKATSRDAAHAILTGINLTASGGRLTLVATDSYRLAISELAVDSGEGEFSLVIPGSTFDEVCKLAPKDGNITIGYSANQIVFEFETSTFVARKLEGNYPNYRQIIPSEKKVSATIDTKTLIDAVKRASIMAHDYMQIRLLISPDSQSIEISSNSADIGRVKEIVDAQIEGDELVIGFNYQYIMDGLTSIDSDEVIFEANAPLKPGVLKSVGEETFFYLSMPVRLND